MMRLTFRIVGRTMFGVDVDGDAAAVGRALSFLVRFTNEHVKTLVRIPTWLPTPRNRAYHNAMTTLDGVVARMVESRVKKGDLGDDLLGMPSPHEGTRMVRGMSDRQMRDDIITVTLAGHETTATALTWTWWLLSKHPEVARRLREEVDAVIGDQMPTPEDLARMPLVAHVIEESMRLYPPVWAIERQATHDDVLMGFRIPSGTTVGIATFLLHRHPAWWDAPNEFRPERFEPEAVAKRPKWSYLPFGGGFQDLHRRRLRDHGSANCPRDGRPPLCRRRRGAYGDGRARATRDSATERRHESSAEAARVRIERASDGCMTRDA